MFDSASRMQAGQQPMRRRSVAAVIGFMAWGALWAYGGGPAGFVVDMTRQVAQFAHTGLTLHIGHDSVDVHAGS